MHVTRKQRIALGTVCIIAVALVMGWFAGRYLPGEPEDPAADTRDILAWSSMQEAASIVDFDPGTAMKLPSLLQGDAHELSEDARKDLSDESIETEKLAGLWERELPSLDVDVTQVRMVTPQSFADFNPAYYGWDKVLADGNMLLVTVELANTSQERYEAWWATLPTFTLWSDKLVNGDNTMGTGISLDVHALSLLNQSVYKEPPDTPSLIDIAPGESQKLELPFRITRNTLSDPNAIDSLKPSDFCLQTSDYRTATTYRLWL